jgi:hypothetical protein
VHRLPIGYNHERAHGPIVPVTDYEITEFILPQPREYQSCFFIMRLEVQKNVAFVLSDAGDQF